IERGSAENQRAGAENLSVRADPMAQGVVLLAWQWLASSVGQRGWWRSSRTQIAVRYPPLSGRFLWAANDGPGKKAHRASLTSCLLRIATFTGSWLPVNACANHTPGVELTRCGL